MKAIQSNGETDLAVERIKGAGFLTAEQRRLAPASPNEDITTLDTTTPSIEVQGSITRS
jgi:hypothetical protein